VGAWLADTAPRRATLPVGELTLAPGVPFALDAGGFDRHTFFCGQSGSGKTYSLGVVLEQLLLETGLRIVILDPNSDFARLGTVRADVGEATAARWRALAQGSTCAARATGGCTCACASSTRTRRRRRCGSTRSPTGPSTPSSPRRPLGRLVAR
jgi:hypothetical protein